MHGRAIEGGIALALALALACGDGGTSDDGGTSGADGTMDGASNPTSADASATQTDASATQDDGPTDDSPTDASADDASSDDGDDTGEPTPSGCDPLPAPEGTIVDVAPGEDLAAAIAGAPAGATVMIADGTYDVGPDGLWVGADGVTVRGASGDREAVVIDGAYQQASGGLLNVSGRDGTTIAHLTLRRARYHLVHVTGAPRGPSTNTRLFDLHLVDPGEQAIKINSNYDFDSDGGEIACSRVELTDEGRAQVMMYESAGTFCYTGGVDAHRARDWVIRDNVIEGFWCSNEYLSEHAIHLWRGCRDTVIERNVLVDNARGVGLGLGMPADGRTYDDEPCPGIAVAEHYGGIVRNNLVVGTRPELFASPSGMDVGIALESACGATIVHNTVASTMPPYSSMEWRFTESNPRVVNNLVTHNLRDRDGAVAERVANLENAPADTFVDLAGHDVHLAAGASAAIDQGDPEGADLAGADFDGDARDGAPDIGADERSR